jgi:hypothetical protein
LDLTHTLFVGTHSRRRHFFFFSFFFFFPFPFFTFTLRIQEKKRKGGCRGPYRATLSLSLGPTTILDPFFVTFCFS